MLAPGASLPDGWFGQIRYRAIFSRVVYGDESSNGSSRFPAIIAITRDHRDYPRSSRQLIFLGTFEVCHGVRGDECRLFFFGPRLPAIIAITRDHRGRRLISYAPSDMLEASSTLNYARNAHSLHSLAWNSLVRCRGMSRMSLPCSPRQGPVVRGRLLSDTFLRVGYA